MMDMNLGEKKRGVSMLRENHHRELLHLQKCHGSDTGETSEPGGSNVTCGS